MAAGTPPRLTPEQYLEIEEQGGFKSEYLAGQMRPVDRPLPTQSSILSHHQHGEIIANVVRLIGNAVVGQSWRVVARDMRVLISETRRALYPDIVVYRDGSWLDDKQDTLLDPRLILEVKSPATEAFDRGEKFRHYRRLPSLTDYILVSQDSSLIEQYHRDGENWLLTEIGPTTPGGTTPEGTLVLANLGIQIAAADIYAGVALGPAAGPEIRMG